MSDPMKSYEGGRDWGIGTPDNGKVPRRSPAPLVRLVNGVRFSEAEYMLYEQGRRIERKLDRVLDILNLRGESL